MLFLDELPEFSRESLEVLRQPLEDGQITVSRAAGSATYPSHFQLVAAMNPCKCGYYGHPTRACTCSPSAVRQYRSRVSGPLLDRIDLCVEMDPVAFDELHGAAPSESSAELRKQVLAARAIQAQRYAAPGYEDVRCNAQLTAGQVRRICRMTPFRLVVQNFDAALLQQGVEGFHIHPALRGQRFGLLCAQGAFAFRQQFLQSHAHFALSFLLRGCSRRGKSCNKVFLRIRSQVLRSRRTPDR